MKFTKGEQELIDFARKKYPEIRKKWRAKGLNDTYYACVLSGSGEIYEGVPFLTELGASHVCCERVAIASMCVKETEKARVKVVLTVGPVGKGGLLTPCGLCRHVINAMSDGKATVLCSGDYFLHTQDADFLFDNMKKYTIRELYPDPWRDGEWE